MIRPDLDAMVKGNRWTVHNRKVQLIEHTGSPAVRFDDGNDRGLAIWRAGEEFANGTIECDLRGKNAHQRSFIGVAFHGLDANTFDLVYFRPFNFKSEDPERRAHAVQYCSLPTHGWHRLRTENPGQYEQAVQPIPDPDDWFHVRIVVEYPRIDVFLNDAKVPSLSVNQLCERKKGWVGLWVGPNSSGDFAALEISRNVYARTLIVL